MSDLQVLKDLGHGERRGAEDEGNRGSRHHEQSASSGVEAALDSYQSPDVCRVILAQVAPNTTVNCVELAGNRVDIGSAATMRRVDGAS